MEKDDIKVIDGTKIYEQLALVQKRPTLLLTSKSITALQNYLNGYIVWALSNKDAYHPNEPDFNNFKYWLLAKNNVVTDIASPYSRMLLLECKGDEEKAFDRFFEYLDKYKQEMGQGKDR